jgi:hypothetical protein
VFHNLFEPAARIRVESIRTPSLGIRQILNDLDALRNQRDATLDEIEYQLSTSDEIEYVAVYDVGQGEAIGLVHKDKVACYFDFGGGAAGNQKTFPNRVKKFCFCNKPPIVLSHWDHDHWSSQGRDKRAHLSTWIVPRQSLKSSKRGLHHSALIRAIVESGGRIMIWPSDVSRHTFGQIVVNQCTGSSKNSSGLALEVLPPSKLDGKPILLPADAGYGDLPNYPADGAYDAVVCPHHGGASNSPTAPKPPAAAYQRLVYSYGKENTYGHPLRRTRRMHHNSLWSDAKVIKRLQPQITRNTADRTKIGVGHVGFEWTATKLPGPLVCDRKKSLQVQQK